MRKKKMKKNLLKQLSILLALMLTIMLTITPMSAEAKGKGKVTYYCASCLTKRQAVAWEGGEFGYLKKISFKKNKVITWGALKKCKGKKYQDKGTLLKSKKRTFKLAKTVKIRCGAGGTDRLEKVSKKFAQSFINEHSGFLCVIKVKGGKITEITLYP